jgi:hypothetical protein
MGGVAAGENHMTRIWRYVLSHDDGIAPCPQDGILSLCTCKPMIRRHAELGEWAIGFAPKRLGMGRVSWAGRVSEKLTLGNYQLKYPTRRDAVYELSDEISSTGAETLVPLTKGYHSTDQLRRRDWSGRNGLVFDPMWYFGGNGIQAPQEIAELAHYYVGQSTAGSSEALAATLEEWLRSQGEPGFYGQPRGGFTACGA